MDAFEQYVRGGMERVGLPVEDFELEVMRYMDQLYGEEMGALMAADQRGLWPESDLDPSRAPRS